jgi:hypothetical protein
MAAGKNEWSLSQLKIEKDRLVKETAELEQKCGSHAISDGVTFDDSSINSLAQHGCELLRSLKSKKARQRQLTEEHEDIDESLEEAKTERLQSEIESLDEAIESGTETLQESQKRLGHAILAGSSDSDDGSFASYFGRKLEIDERMREISRQMAELQENREALKTSLGFDIKKVGLAAVAILIIAGIALAVWLSGGGASNMTVEEFKAKIGWQGVASHEKDEFYQLVGKPDKIQEVGDSVYLYYQCSGGRLQLVCNKAVYEYGNTILVTTINRW